MSSAAPVRLHKIWLGCAWLLALVLCAVASRARAQERGFAVDRYEGSTAGSALFLVDRPWYSDTRWFAVGLTLDGALNPLVPAVPTGRGALAPIVSQALLGHVDVAGSLFDRVLLHGSLPVTLFEQGTPEPVSQSGPLAGPALGDPRVGARVRLLGQPDQDPFSLHLGTDLWIPIGRSAVNQGDGAARAQPRLTLAGALGVMRWTVDAGAMLRSYASIGPPALGMTAASEARLGLGLGVALFDERVVFGPEVRAATPIAGPNAFTVSGSSVEVLGGAQVLIADHVLVGLAVGAGFLDAAGTPDARALVRVGWAPRSTRQSAPATHDTGPPPADTTHPASDDADGDTLTDAEDRCPYEPETKNGVRDDDGCPETAMAPDSPLARVLAPRAAQASTGADTTSSGGTAAPHAGAPVENTAGAPAPAAIDADGDGLADEADACPVIAEDKDDFEDEDGCPEPDNDRDGVADAADRCPFEAEAPNGIDDDDGCPDIAPDADKDGIADLVDRCPIEPESFDGLRDDDGCPELAAPSHDALARLLSPPVAVGVTGLAATGAPDTAAALGQGDADRDGVLDEADRCPVTPEDADGFEDDDGCPEPDNDGDGVADASDSCPFEAETVNGWQDADGCADEHADTDGDGVSYADDRCPYEAGDAADGCPHVALPPLALAGFPGAATASAPEAPQAAAAEPDQTGADLDRDGIADAADRCPVTPEDVDAFEDEDGCPEPDNDVDGVLDVKDKCAFEAETINGTTDDDGCPDGGTSEVSIEGQNVVIKGVVLFKPGSAQLAASSLALLKQVASALKAQKSITVEIQGHTDDVGNAAKNIRLSKDRAEAIRKVLIQQGVDGNRLLATGYGPTRPRASNATLKGREQNRRVEFLILGETK